MWAEFSMDCFHHRAPRRMQIQTSQVSETCEVYFRRRHRGHRVLFVLSRCALCLCGEMIYIKPGILNPPVSGPNFASAILRDCSTASLTAATIKSCSISTSAALTTSGLMLIATTF